MSVPAVVLPADKAIRPTDGSSIDAWSIIINLDPAKDWSGSTFTVDGTAAFTVDASHKTDDAPFVTVNLTPDVIEGITVRAVHWNLTENVVLARTFLKQTVTVFDR